MGAILKRAWGNVCAGNLENMHKAAAEFVNEYKEYTFKHEEMEWEPITGEQVVEECTECSHSAHGPDGFEPAEMTLLPLEAHNEMARLMNNIEQGAE